MNRVNIGKNYLNYAQKFGSYGSAKRPIAGFSPFAKMTNSVRYSKDTHVLAPSATKHAINWGLQKARNWYRTAVKAIDKKNAAA